MKRDPSFRFISLFAASLTADIHHLISRADSIPKNEWAKTHPCPLACVQVEIDFALIKY